MAHHTDEPGATPGDRSLSQVRRAAARPTTARPDAAAPRPAPSVVSVERAPAPTALVAARSPAPTALTVVGPGASAEPTSARAPVAAAAQAPAVLAPAPPQALPAADALPIGDPEAPSPPPGPAPSGDARSLRGLAADGTPLFAVVYRDGATVITGRGRVGQRGRWQAVQYPSMTAAASAYARGCARLCAEGFVDLQG